MNLRILMMSIIIGMVFCLSVCMATPATAQDTLSIQRVVPMPDKASLNARYEITFITSENGALQGGADAIYIIFPAETQLPSSVDEKHVSVDGISLSQGNEIIIDGHTLVITPVNDVAAGSRCTVLFSQAAGIVNPPLSQELGDGATDDLYVITVSTDNDSPDTFEYEITDWVGASPMALAQYDPCTVWGAGFMPGTTIQLNGLEGGPVRGSGIVDRNGFFRFTGLATGYNDANLIAYEGSGRTAEVMGDEPELKPGQPPVAVFEYEPVEQARYPQENPAVNEEVLFDASASTDPDSSIVTWHWDFGDGNVGMGETVTHSYTMSGEYTVDLLLTDTTGATSSTRGTVMVTEYVPLEGNNEPLADAGPDQDIESEATEEVEVILNASESTDPDGDLLTYFWSWESGSAVGMNPSIQLDQGTTSITLTVSDGEFTSTDSVIISIGPGPVETVAPTPTETLPVFSDVKFTYQPRTPIVGETITFDGSDSVIAEGPVASYQWVFGDEETDSGVETTHVYDEPGIYTVSLFLRDSYGNVYSYTTNINVVEAFTPSETPDTTITPPDDTASDSSPSPVIWIVIVIVVIVAAAVGVFFLRRRLKVRPSE